MNLEGETNLKMNFLKCSIAVTAYGVLPSEVELAAEKHMTFDIGDQYVRLYKEVSMEVNLLFLGHSSTGTMLFWVGKQHGSCS